MPEETRTDSVVTARDWAAVTALGLAVFTITTTEIMPIGLLQPMAADLGVSEGLIGLTVTVFAFVAAVAAPTLSSLTRRIDRRTIALAVMAVFVVGNTLTALAPNYATLVIVRVVIGVALGQMWTIVAPTAVALVSTRHAVRANTIAFSGVSIASVAGMPLGTFIGQLAGWQSAYWALSGLSAMTVVALAVFMTPVAPAGSLSLRRLPSMLRERNLRVTIIITALVITGAYAAYTYVTPLIVDTIGIDADLVSAVLLAMGVAGVAGNFAAGAFLTRTRSIRGSLGVLVGLLAVALVLVVATSSLTPLVLMVWSAGYAAIPIGLQTTVLRVAPAHREAATTIYSTTFNLSIGLGALVGAVAIDRAGSLAPTLIGAICAVAALAVTLRLPTRV
ncbi:MFS transporter [Gordonia sp. VNQ95]|uniref:MFS transporter n=1 Tax=Gordonia sp. VNQ95 TaxID=3156619 RepID=UPI0032B3DAAB